MVKYLASLDDIVYLRSFGEDKIRAMWNKYAKQYDYEEFKTGMEVELEHKNVTKGDPDLTAKIAVAHLKEKPNYYTLLKKYVEGSKD